MTPEQFHKNLAKMAIELKKFTEDTGPDGAPTIIGKKAADFFTDNIRVRSGFLNRGLQPWKEVKRRLPKANGRPYTNKEATAAGRKILVGRTGNLSRSIEYDRRPGHVTIYSDATYAPYHNEGTDKLPKRQFIGDSAELDKLVTSELERKLNKIIR